MRVLDLFDLTGRVALVTGGSRGLGLEIAQGLGEAGATVIITARRQEWLDPAVHTLREAGITAEAAACDVVDADAVEALVAGVVDRHAGIDILVNAAGVAWGAPAVEMPAERFRWVLDVNATGTFLCCQAVGRRMLDRGRGRIVNVASVTGLVGQAAAVLDAVGYTASKGAVVALTRDLAAKWGSGGVTVNALAPGFFLTRMTQSVIEQSEAALAAATPLGRIGRPDELKGAAVFLVSDAAAYVNGQILAVDGGMTAW
jgi:NAD(P)-dependent dehydrogenase (short-subunit alcohol dehydrogenase family)